MPIAAFTISCLRSPAAQSQRAVIFFGPYRSNSIVTATPSAAGQWGRCAEQARLSWSFIAPLQLADEGATWRYNRRSIRARPARPGWVHVRLTRRNDGWVVRPFRRSGWLDEGRLRRYDLGRRLRLIWHASRACTILSTATARRRAVVSYPRVQVGIPVQVALSELTGWALCLARARWRHA